MKKCFWGATSVSARSVFNVLSICAPTVDAAYVKRDVRSSPALVDDQPAPHCGEQLEEGLQEEADGKKTSHGAKTFRTSAWKVIKFF